MKQITPRMMTEIAAAAALYVVLTVMFHPLSYGAVQIRFSEAMMLLCCFRIRWCAALSLGCMIANLFSGMSVDFLFGTLATVIAAVLMYLIRKPVPAAFVPAAANGFIIAAELYFFAGEPYWFSVLTVAAGEIVAVVVIGLPLLWALRRSEAVSRLLFDRGKSDRNDSSERTP